MWASSQVHGVRYGQHPNATKTLLIIKEEHKEEARQLSAGTDVNISTSEKRHLAAAIGWGSLPEKCVVIWHMDRLMRSKSLPTLLSLNHMQHSLPSLMVSPVPAHIWHTRCSTLTY